MSKECVIVKQVKIPQSGNAIASTQKTKHTPYNVALRNPIQQTTRIVAIILLTLSQT